MSKHTPEPWPSFIDVCEPATPHPDSNEIVRLGFDDYRRARTCVNACRGIGTDELEQHGLVSAVGYELIELTKQRDELLAALDKISLIASDSPMTHNMMLIYQYGNDAIAKAKGGAS